MPDTVWGLGITYPQSIKRLGHFWRRIANPPQRLTEERAYPALRKNLAETEKIRIFAFIIWSQTNKNNNMVNVNFSKAKCPTCGKKVSLRVISKYFWHGTSYYTECNHCGQRIHPAKEPVSIFKCFSWGGMSVLLPMYSYWNLVAWDLLPALLCAIPFILLTLLISCILVVRKIQFII